MADGHNLNHRVRYNHSAAPWYFSGGGTVEDTYWKSLINKLGAKLGVNDSWAGSRVHNSSNTDSGDQGPNTCMASITRITNLGSNGTPDLILYYGGTNDCGGSVTLGSFDSTITYTTDLSSKTWADFATAYKDSIMRLQYFYPNAKILVLLPTYCTSYYTYGNLDKYNEIIKNVCDYFGVEYIDFRRCGINAKNLGTTLGDGIHPTKEGFHLMGRYLYNKLLSMYSEDGVENVVYTVTNDLSNNINTDRYIKGVSAGKSYNATITGSTLAIIKVSMNGVDITSSAYNSSTGVISISNVTGNILIEEDEATVYTITTNVTKGSYTGATSIIEGGSTTITVTPYDGCTLPASVTVTGASYTYNSTLGTIALTNPTSNVIITVICEGTALMWYTNDSYNGTTAAAVTGYGWAPKYYNTLVGKPINMVGFVSPLNSGTFEVGKSTFGSSTYSDVQSVNWDSSNKTSGNTVIIELPNTITLNENECFVVFPQTQPATNALYYATSGGSGFYTDVPVSRRENPAWKESTANLNVNVGYKED